MVKVSITYNNISNFVLIMNGLEKVSNHVIMLAIKPHTPLFVNFDKSIL